MNFFKQCSSLLCVVAVLLTSCQKEAIEVKSGDKLLAMQTGFAQSSLHSLLSEQGQVQWNSPSKLLEHPLLGLSYYEFPVAEQNPTEMNDKYQQQWSLMVVPEGSGFSYFSIKYFIQKDHPDQVFLQKVSLQNLKEFSGLIHIMDDKDAFIYAAKVLEGTISDEKNFTLPSESQSNERMMEDCVTTTTYSYIDWYVNGVYVDSDLISVDSETDCSIYFLPDLVSSGGGGKGVYRSNSGGNQYANCENPESPCRYALIDKNFDLVDIAPDTPIEDMVEFLRCFDLSQDAVLTVFIDQPKKGSSDAWKSTWNGTLIGHAFIAIQQGGKTSVFGFYPSGNNVTPLHPTNPSAMGDDSNAGYDVSVSTNISGSILQKIIQNAINRRSTYNLNTYNCTDFVIEIGNLAGLNLPSANGVWPGGGGSNPGALGQFIRTLNSGYNRSVNTFGGKAPKNRKGC